MKLLLSILFGSGYMGFIYNTLESQTPSFGVTSETRELVLIQPLEELLLMEKLVKCCLLYNLARLTAGKECTPEKTFQSCMTTQLHFELHDSKFTCNSFRSHWTYRFTVPHIILRHITSPLASENCKHFCSNEEYNCRKKRDF